MPELADAKPDAPTFHEVVFGEGDDEQQRFSFEEFRDLSLRKRVRLLMSMPSKFYSVDGEEISRDAAMRFRQGAAPVKGPTSAPRGEEDRVDRLIRLLRESTLEHELRGCVKLAETIELTAADQRDELASALLRTASLLEDEHGSTPLSWAALRRFGTLVPTARLVELRPFLAQGNEAETMQAALQTIWSALSVDEDFGLGVLAVRSRQLLNKYLDPDWLCSAIARALAVDLLLAYSVLVPAVDEPGLRAIYKRARGLGDAFPLALARAEIDEALSEARRHERPIAARLQLLCELCD